MSDLTGQHIDIDKHPMETYHAKRKAEPLTAEPFADWDDLQDALADLLPDDVAGPLYDRVLATLDAARPIEEPLSAAHKMAVHEYQAAQPGEEAAFHEGRVSAYAHALEEVERLAANPAPADPIIHDHDYSPPVPLDAAREGLDVELRRLRFGAYDGECSHGFGPPSSTCPNTECEDRAIDNWIAALSTEPEP